jgi:hypothetical protein
LRVGEGSKETFSTTGTVEIIHILHKMKEQMISNSTSSLMKILIHWKRLQKNQKNGKEEHSKECKLY